MYIYQLMTVLNPLVYSSQLNLNIHWHHLSSCLWFWEMLQLSYHINSSPLTLHLYNVSHITISNIEDKKLSSSLFSQNNINIFYLFINLNTNEWNEGKWHVLGVHERIFSIYVVGEILLKIYNTKDILSSLHALTSYMMCFLIEHALYDSSHYNPRSFHM